MPKCLILVDNSNVFIEGKKLSARRKGVQRQPMDTREPQDPPGALISASYSLSWLTAEK